jgi:hypothetical protein
MPHDTERCNRDAELCGEGMAEAESRVKLAYGILRISFLEETICLDLGARYALCNVHVGQSDGISNRDGHAFPERKEYGQTARSCISEGFTLLRLRLFGVYSSKNGAAAFKRSERPQ